MKITTKLKFSSKQPAARSRQQGAVLVLYTIGMLAILALAGLALDVPHAMLNKTRLQNNLDAAALAAAEVLDDTGGNTTLATDMAKYLFDANMAAAGHSEMAAAISWGNVEVQYSATLEPFTPGSVVGPYVRVRVKSFQMPEWLIQLLPLAPQKQVRASAVAGPSPTLGSACDLVPLLICGDTTVGGPLWGYQDGEITVLKGSSKSGTKDGPIGPGNFQLARLGGNGANVVRDNLAGGYAGCASLGATIPTQPGNATGPVAKGLNTRFTAADGYKPDVVTTQQDPLLVWDQDTGIVTSGNNGPVVQDSSDIDFNYDDYTQRISDGSYDNTPPAGIFDRRNLSVVIVDCDGKNTGQESLPVLGFACYFLLQEVAQKGNADEVYGEFVQECEAKGNVGPDPTVIPGPYKLQLYKDVNSKDS